MEQFFIRVLTAVVTSDAVQKMLSELMRNAADTVKGDIEGLIKETEQSLIDKYDALDGKMGNVEEQLTKVPGEIIAGVIDGVVGSIEKAIKDLNPLGGLFGQQ